MFALKSDAMRSLVLASLALGAVIACNNVAHNPDHSDSVIEVVSATPVSSDPSNTSASDSTTLVLRAQPRNPNATTFFNDVSLTNYTVAFSPGLLGPFSGVVGAGFVPAGGTATVTLVVVPASAKPLALAGTTLIAQIGIKLQALIEQCSRRSIVALVESNESDLVERISFHLAAQCPGPSRPFHRSAHSRATRCRRHA